MTETLTLFFPCDILPVRARFGYGDTISPIEKTTLQLIAARTAAERLDVHQLTELLGLTRRVVLDLLQDMWRQGYVTLDFRTGQIALSGKLARSRADGDLEGLPSTESVEEVVEIMLDRIGGLVQPVPGSGPIPERDALIHHPRPELTLRDTPLSELFRALRHHFDRAAREPAGARANRGKRLISASLTPGLRDTPRRRWLPVEVTAARDPASERLIVRITDRDYPETRRQTAEAVLANLVERHPNEPFALKLKALANRVPLAGDQPALADRLDALLERAARAAEIPPGQRWNRHKEFCQDARGLISLLDQRYRREAIVETITGKQHVETVRSLIADARVQLVLVCPWVHFDSLAHYEDDLAEARRRGVQIVIVWGMNHKDKLDRMAENSLDSLARIPSAVKFVRSPLPARTHAKAVICDDRRALVTSSNILGTKGTRREVGLLVSDASGKGSEVVLDLLGWARAAIPDGPTSRELFSHATDFELLDPQEGAVHKPPDETDPEASFPAADPDLDNAGEERVRAWAAAWTAYAEGLRAELAARTLPSIDMATDGRHRELMWRAIGRAERRLVIASDQISDEVVDDRFAADLERRLAESGGLRITLIYDRESAEERGTRAVERLRWLAHAHPDRITVRKDRNHAKAIVCDDELLVGSFNFLSYGGFRTLGSPHLQRSELSLWLTDPVLAAEVTAALGAGGGDEAAPRSARFAPVDAPQVDPAVQRLLDPLLAAAGEPERLANVVAELLPADDPWPVLSALDSAGAAYVLRIAAARALSMTPPDTDQATRWRHWLIRDLWERRRFVEAALLRAADPAADPRPRRALAVTAAARGTRFCADALLEALLDEPESGEAAALMAVASAEMVVNRSHGAREWLSDLRKETTEPWHALGDLCRDYLDAANAPLTPALLSSLSELDRRREREVAAWDELARALAAAQQLTAKIVLARQILVAFFRTDGPFGRLATAVEHQDAEGVRAFLSGPLDRRGDIRKQLIVLINQTGAEVAPNRPPLHSKLLDSFVLRLRPVVQHARALADLAEEDTGESGAGPNVPVLSAATTLQKGLTRLMPELRSAAAQLEPTERQLARACLADLAHVLNLEDADD
ncbi:hypothetical protein GCM10023085_62140 [Actinomadura viridis]|uniref:Phosphatidylserine/phosphatidylglycerophosphate/ cardiolipin synthase-like enzyme n=1 Tax=Actinomadura viridis TaxID=58110 RepID=A0A931DBX9_9ACTN|nr:phospholipase D-like domain-containing protein [Actinomadura viridis]MBG6086064.1 phosphatidylserine/phosphatidylglycerophosphate/cardiolipin synthase-like enzyme [Actinomadura viridis]